MRRLLFQQLDPSSASSAASGPGEDGCEESFIEMQSVSMFRLSLPCFFCTVCGIASGHEELLQIAAGLFHGIFAGDYRLGGAAVCFNAVSGERCKS